MPSITFVTFQQNVYIGEETEEPEFEYVPETPRALTEDGKTAAGSAYGVAGGVGGSGGGAGPLSQSMLLLEESLDSGAIVGQFEQLYRRNPGLVMSICHRDENVTKNRYRDISPYDSTRVVLSSACPTGDYVNANHVKMTIPGSGIINRYVATQGPLSTTTIDFWYMAWECQSNLVIMLTTIVERGRIKCHKYWPDVGETIEFDGGLSVKCISEHEHQNFAYRDFTMTMRKGKKAKAKATSDDDAAASASLSSRSSGRKSEADDESKDTAAEGSEPDIGKLQLDDDESTGDADKQEEGEESNKEEEDAADSDSGDEGEVEEEVRHITQMAYSSWPDHGVPEHHEEFVGFVEQVRDHREGNLHPTLVHCSAGIGRTGVLILMETALCLIEANQPVFPLDLTRQMRDQRASMIQTPSQYRFVCEAILKVYKEQRVKPLPEFCADA